MIIDFHTKKKIDAGVRSAVKSLEQENTAIAETPNVRFQRLLKIFAMLKPLLSFLVSFPVIPQLWRTGLNVLVQLLESLAVDGGNVVVQFKAGKDLALDPAATP